jgi:hypothetical protein
MTHSKALLGGLSMACLLLALLAGDPDHSPGRVASAAPDPLATMRTALATASSYQVTYSAHSTEVPPATERRTLVLVRQGTGFLIHALDASRPSGAGDTTIVEDVVSGATVCERVAFNVPRGPYTCGEKPALAAALAVRAEPAYGLVGARATVGFAAASARTIGGQRCAGYRFSAHAGTSHSSGTVYVAPSGLPCEQDATTDGPAIGPSTAQARATVRSVTVWSRSNDPHLAMPAGVLPATATNGSFVVQPAAARVGQTVTLSGRTRGGEMFLPPFVQMASAKLHTDSRPTTAQCGGTAAEPVAFGQVVPAGRYLARGAPAGKTWQVSFKVPARLTTYAGGIQRQIPTPPGVYRLVASFGPAFFCPSALPTARGEFALAGRLTVRP